MLVPFFPPTTLHPDNTPSDYPCPGLDVSRRRRAYSTNQISSQKTSPRPTTASDPTGIARRHPLRKAKVQDLANQGSSESPRWQIDLQVSKQGWVGRAERSLVCLWLTCNNKDGAFINTRTQSIRQNAESRSI